METKQLTLHSKKKWFMSNSATKFTLYYWDDKKIDYTVRGVAFFAAN